MKQDNKRILSFLGIVIISLITLSAIINFPRVNAVTPTINNVVGSSTTSNSSTGASNLIVTSIGDTIAVLIITSAGNGNCPITINSVIDTTTGASLTKATENCLFGTAVANNGSPSTGIKTDQSIWYLTGGATAASTQTITITFSSTGQRAAWTFYDVSNVSNTPLGAVQTSSSGLTIINGGTQAISTGITQDFSSPALLLAMAEFDSSSTCNGSGSTGTGCTNSANLPNSGCSTSINCLGTFVAGSGFSSPGTLTGLALGSCTSASNNFANSCASGGFEASTSASISSPTSFPWTASAAATLTMYNFFWTMTGIAFAASGSTPSTCTITTCFTTLNVTFNLADIFNAGNPLSRVIGVTFHMSELFSKAFITILKFVEKFNMLDAFCIVTFSCKFNIPSLPNTTTYVLYDSSLNFFITAIVLPIVVIFGVIVAMKRGADIKENMVLPIALFTILMIAWGGQGLIFPQWVSLLIVLVSGGGLAYTIVGYFTKRGESE